MTNSYELHEARRGNVSDHQIGGITDGITEEVAADLGFETQEDYMRIRASVGNLATAAERPQDIRISSTVIVENRPKNAMSAQERAFAMAEKARQRSEDGKTVEEMYAEMWANERSSDDNREMWSDPSQKPDKKLTIAEQNANEDAHWKKARQDRRGK